MLLFITDTETTGFDSKTHKTIEVAACLYDTKSKSIIRTFQSLFYADSNPVEDVNHISQASLDASKTDIDYRKIFRVLAGECDVIIAHNKEFDRGFFIQLFGDDLGKPWVCSQEEIVFPNTSTSHRLGHLAYDHNIPVIGAHRALADTNILVQLIMQVPDIEEQITNAPLLKFYASTLPFDKKDLLKSAGFTFDGTIKKWKKKLSPNKYAELKDNLALVEVK